MADSEGTPEVILSARGSEVQLTIEVYEVLKREDIKAWVVSMPNWNLYERQRPAYRKTVLPSKVKARVAIEAGSTFGWRRFVGLHGDGEVLGMRTFGASGKLNTLLEEFGLTVEVVVETSKKLWELILKQVL